MIRAILTDIEGTTSSIAFVKEVLFPYARARMGEFARAHGGEREVRALLDEVSALRGESLDDEAVVAQLIEWIDQDRKIAPLKALQGMIWEAGYREGDFHGHVYADAARLLAEWKARGLILAIFSSGSVWAQRLLFGHTEHGDLTLLFRAYFDTRVGAKQESSAYAAIAAQMDLPAGEILFLSDIAAELDAARDAGMATCQLLREGATPAPNHVHAVDFDAVDARLRQDGF